LLRSSRLRRKAMAKLYRLFGSSDYRAAGAMRQTLVKVVNEDHSHLLSKIHCPTLLVWGDQDTDTPLWMAKKMEQEIKDCGLVVFSGAGHYSFLDRSQQFCLVAAKFLEG
ncbi:MAG: alpha/beta hydrolase, partial [Bdellovibrionales bacterium]|nr:alpha/beta hydrolase [Bdellovibrionales bacterium]